MRIVHLTPLYAPSVGGYQTLIRQFSERLARKGHDVSVITTTACSPEAFTQPNARRQDSPAGEEEQNGVRVLRLKYRALPRIAQYPFDWLMDFFWRRRLWRNDALRTFWLGPQMIGLNAALDALKPQVLLAGPLPFATPYHGVVAARRLGIPCVVIPCLHSHQVWEFENKGHFEMLSKADALALNTDYEIDLARLMGATPREVCVLGPGIDPTELAGGNGDAFRSDHGIAKEDTIVLFVGRKEEGKGVFHLIDAMREVWEKETAVTFVFAGPVAEAWTRAAAPFTGSNRVIDLPTFNDAQKKNMFAAADIVTLPSRVESMGIVFLEGWACSKPVVGCRTGPVSSVIDDRKNGLLVPFGDPLALGEAIVTLAADKPMRQSLGRSGRQKVGRKYKWDHLTDRLEALYAELIGARP